MIIPLNEIREKLELEEIPETPDLQIKSFG